ncbi:MAG: hypothetical protein JWN94_4474 [Betaproteobacteria bacterium]|nr:hypothetical protein [Betaproteobacteria bacterium]
MSNHFPIVGIGASAGGLEATKSLLANIPADPGMAFVLIQHMDASHPSELSKILARSTTIPVSDARHGEEVLANHFYVIPCDGVLEIFEGHFALAVRGRSDHSDFLIDRFLRSLARDAKQRAVAVILSGSGSDGELGACEVKAAGGVAIAQDEESAGHTGMPRAAAQSGCVDFVLSPAEIANCLMRLVDHDYLAPLSQADAPGQEQDYDDVVQYLRGSTGVDFSQYRSTTIRRRILRRAMLLGYESIRKYLEHLKEDKPEVLALHFDLLINVTSFFRDETMFECLEQKVIPAILDAKTGDAPVRVWVAGCSTGQEAYSIAMLLLEASDIRPHRTLQVFATDLSGEDVLAKARAGMYPASIETEISSARLQRFFDKVDTGYRVKKLLRDMCIFAQQNIATDPPFSHVDLITCRNVLIYMSPALQQRVIPIFHYALNVPGFLVLGGSENVGSTGHQFELFDRVSKVFVKRVATTTKPLPASAFSRLRDPAAILDRSPSIGDFHVEADRVLLERYAPPGVLIDDNLNVLEFRGRTTRYLEMPAGQPTTSMLKLAHDGLILELRNAINEVKKTDAPVLRHGVRVTAGGVTRTVNLELVPISLPTARYRCYLVLFHDADDLPAGVAANPQGSLIRDVLGWMDRKRTGQPARLAGDGANPEVERLHQEHEATKEFLQSLLDERDSSNEELRAANEEVLSSNEELQSTNEELQTAKEELQSVNEELTTVNEQLNSRNAELTQINNDFLNLLTSSSIPLVAVGSDLRIRFHTPPATAKMNLMPADIGRPIGHIRPSVAVQNLEDLVRRVIETQQPLHEELRDRDDRWHSLRIYPYRAGERIDGAVIVLVDIDDIKRGQDLLQQQASMLKLADQRKNEFLAMLGHELRNPLGPMANVLHILRQDDSREHREQALGVLERQLAQLTRIVEDLLDATRISQGKIELKRERLNVNTVLRAAIETSRPALEASGQRFEVQFCDDDTANVYADPLRLTQVLVNLLNNAAKFTPKNGQIELICHAEDSGEIQIRVRDNGIGMSPDLIDHVFDLFAQGDTFENRRRGGLGIGLTLARKLVDLHGGSIRASSKGEGQGSEFVVSLPPAAAAVPHVLPRPDRSFANPDGNCRIVVIEDNIDQAQTLAALLSLWGYEVKTANEGTAGIQVAEEFKPDVVLVDLGLPGISGYEVARRIRKHPHLKDVCIVAQTGWGDTSDRRRTREAGFDHHLLKPLDPEDLRGVIARKRATI